MKITLFQQDIAWLDPEVNYKKIETILQENADTELLVLPEMCNTGFITLPKPEEIEKAEDIEQHLLDLSAKYGTAICGSFATSSPNATGQPTHYNRCYFATPEGEIHSYDKRHLFSPGQEDKGYTPGQDRVMIEWRGIRFLLTICYDLRFPTWLRHNEQTPYDILICVANWPAARQLAWDTLLRARAIENQSYCIGVNRVGQDPQCNYQGGTCAIHPYGHTVASCPDHTESLCSFVPDMEKLKEFRRKFPALRDADKG